MGLKSKIGQKTDKNSGAKRLRGSRVQDKARERIINKGNQGIRGTPSKKTVKLRQLLLQRQFLHISHWGRSNL